MTPQLLSLWTTRFGCGVCTVHLDGVAVRACVTPMSAAAPATVEIGPWASNAFGVQVRQLLFFGGALANQAFHAAVIC